MGAGLAGPLDGKSQQRVIRETPDPFRFFNIPSQLRITPVLVISADVALLPGPQFREQVVNDEIARRIECWNGFQVAFVSLMVSV